MVRIPSEARDGLMRAWLDILRERHPEVAWIPAETVDHNEERGEQVFTALIELAPSMK